MKKLISVILILMLFVSVVGCDNANEDVIPSTTTQKTTTTTVTTTKATTTTTTVPTTTTKNKEKPAKTTEIKKEIIPIDKFDSIQQMVSKAKKYKSIEDIYSSAGYDKHGHYYISFSKDKLSLLFEDKQIIVPGFSDEIQFINGGLYPQGYYLFNLSYENIKIHLFINTYKNASLLKENDKPKFVVNDINIYYDGLDYFWLYKDYCVKIRGIGESEIKNIVNNINLNIVKI